MVYALPPINGNQSGIAPQGARPSAPPKLFVVGSPAADQLPDLPPAEVLDALDTAARVLGELDRNQIQFRIEHDPATQQVRVHVVADGKAEREIHPQRLLNILAGDTSSLAADKNMSTA
jgi:hypothetical protein